MKLEKLSEYLSVTIITVLGCLLAAVCGQWTGSYRLQGTLMLIGGIIGVTVALVMRSNIWLLIPLTWLLKGKMIGLPGELPLCNAIIIYVLFAIFALKALKIVNTKPVYKWLDYILLINLFYILLMFVRNPVGTASIKTDLVGGRPYFDIAFAAIAYWIIAHFTISPRLARIFPLLTLGGNFLVGIINFITYHFPSTVPIIGGIYTGISVDTYFATDSSNTETQREGYLGKIGTDIGRLLASFYNPITLVNPLFFGRCLMFLLAVFFIFRSGFRSELMGLIAFFFLGSYFRRGIAEVMPLIFISAPILICIILMNGVLFDLPLPAQRALAFLPGNWDHRVIEDAEGSTGWRVQIWKNVWNSNQYIHDRWFGDGFGLPYRDFYDCTIGANRNSQESLTITGDYHSGPLSAIKFAGYLGLALILCLMFGAAIFAWKLIGRARGTPYFVFSIFIGIDAVFFPLKFIFIFGSYKTEIPLMIYSVAMLSLIDRSLAEWKEKQAAVSDENKDPFREGAGFAFPDFPTPRKTGGFVP